MFTCFVVSSSFVYFFHVFQNEATIRGYLTAASLLTSYFFQFQKYDKRMSTMWACFFAWVVYSNIYYDIRTHWYGVYRLLKHIVFAFFPFAAATKLLKNNKVLKTLFWVVILVGPDVSSNVYGNALFSILRNFCATITIMTRLHNSDGSDIEEFAWVYFCHEIVLAFVVLQMLFDFLPLELHRRYPFIRNNKQHVPSDVIGAHDVPSYIIGGKRTTTSAVAP
jgi:hypothetical protein